MFPIHFKYHFSNEVNSTNNWIKTFEPHNGLVAYTSYQNNGRGMAANKWESEANKNLLCSILLELPFIKIEQQAHINMAVSIALQAVVHNLTQTPCYIKWPNDIYICNKKIAGILIENSIQGSCLKQTIIGIGLNINQETFENKNAISLKNILNHTLNIEEVLYQLTHQIALIYALLNEGKLTEIATQYNNFLYRKGVISQFILNNTICEAQIENVNKYGLLQLLMNNQIVEFAHKEIEMVI